MSDVMQSQVQVVRTIRKALEKLKSIEGQQLITDICLQPIQSTGELCICDDDDHELIREEIVGWSSYVPESFDIEVEAVLRTSLRHLEQEGVLDGLPILKPYSFVMVDENGETLADLLLVDDDTMFLTDTLLEGLDKELDEFLKQLLAD